LQSPPARFVHALALGVRPGWRLLSDQDRSTSAVELIESIEAETEVTSYTYSTIGLKAGTDIVLWRLAASPDALDEAAARVLRTGLGKWLTLTLSFLGLVTQSQYVRRPLPETPALFWGPRARYLVTYPFTKTPAWYGMDADERLRVMKEHMKVGHQHGSVKQLLANSFGLDDMDFLVAYETDDLAAFSDLVRRLRETESRRYTYRDTPILVGVHRPMSEIAAMLGARVEGGESARRRAAPLQVVGGL
jgi:chlorite dismutase